MTHPAPDDMHIEFATEAEASRMKAILRMREAQSRNLEDELAAAIDTILTTPADDPGRPEAVRSAIGRARAAAAELGAIDELAREALAGAPKPRAMSN